MLSNPTTESYIDSEAETLAHEELLSVFSDLSVIDEWQNKLNRRIKAGLVPIRDRILAQNCLDEMTDYNNKLLDQLLKEPNV